jgi:hypothetical protein
MSESLQMVLTMDQVDRLRHIQWLLDDDHIGPRCTGRTYLLAVVFIQKALNTPEKGVQVFDHAGPHLPGSGKRVLTEIRKIWNQQTHLHNRYELQVNPNNAQIVAIRKECTSGCSR